MSIILSLPIPAEGSDDPTEMSSLLAQALEDLPAVQTSTSRAHIRGVRHEIIDTAGGPRLALYPLTSERDPST